MKLIIFDIGSNSVRTARLTTDELGLPQLSNKHVYTTRLAEGLAETGALSQARILQSLLVIRSVYTELAAQGFSAYAYATSAVRDASNGKAFISSVEQIIGKDRARILTGGEEASFAQQGADPDGTHTIIDIGGGSTQIVRAASRESWPIGCVRAKDLAPYQDLSMIGGALTPILSGLFGPPNPEPCADRTIPGKKAGSAERLLGVGGTITTLALLCEGRDTFSPWQGEKKIEFLALSAVLSTLDSLGDAARANIPLLKDRHDVILHGGVILQYLMDKLCCTQLGATLCDGLDGYAMHLFRTLSK